MRLFILIVVVLSSCCGAWALSGYGISEANSLDTQNPELYLTSPLGGEEWYFWHDWDINWSIVEPNLDPGSMELWYSLNGGWDFISLGADIPVSPPFTWILPEAVSHQVKIRARVKDSFGNTTTTTSGAFSIDFEPPASPQNLTVTITSDESAILLWSPVTTTVLGNPMAPDGYIILFSQVPDAPIDDYTFLAAQKALSYTHEEAAIFHDSLFYRIVAYINYDWTLDHKLKQLQNTHGASLNWGTIRTELCPHRGDNR